MTSADLKVLMPDQEKLEWVTPKISLIGAGESEGTNKAIVGTPEFSATAIPTKYVGNS